MRHRKAGKKLGRTSSHRRAMLRNMVTSLFKFEQLETTDAKARELRPVAEKMIGLAKRGDLHARRQALGFMQDKTVTHKLFEEIKDRFIERQGGYVRIVKKGFRKGDGAPVSVIQLLPDEKGKKKAKKKGKTVAPTGSSVEKTKKEQKVEEKPAAEKEEMRKEEGKEEEKATEDLEKKDSE